MGKLIKNMNSTTVLPLDSLVDYQAGQVVSRTLAQNRAVSLTLFAFDEGEEISSHASDGDALVTILDGRAHITVGGEEFVLEKGQSIVMPAGIPHALQAQTKFKMQLTVIFPE